MSETMNAYYLLLCLHVSRPFMWVFGFNNPFLRMRRMFVFVSHSTIHFLGYQMPLCPLFYNYATQPFNASIHWFTYKFIRDFYLCLFVFAISHSITCIFLLICYFAKLCDTSFLLVSFFHNFRTYSLYLYLAPHVMLFYNFTFGWLKCPTCFLIYENVKVFAL